MYILQDSFSKAHTNLAGDLVMLTEDFLILYAILTNTIRTLNHLLVMLLRLQ